MFGKNLTSENRNKRIKQLSIFIFLILLTRLISLGTYPVMDKTESRYAEISREMIVTNNWVTLQLEPGVPFWGKPPLSTWSSALSAKVFGINAFGVRLPSLLFSIIICVLVYLLGKRLQDKLFGLLCVSILASIGLFWTISGSVMTDPALLACITLSLVSFYFCLQFDDGRNKLWGYAFFIGLGLSLLAKGPLGWVMIFFPIMIWCSIFHKWTEAYKKLPWGTGLILALLIALPWHLLAEQRTPGFLNYYFVGEHFKRFVVKDWKGDLYGSAHVQPKGMIWVFGIPSTMPWIIIFVALLFRKIKQGAKLRALWKDPALCFFTLWFLTPFIFFTFASNIAVHYCFVATPAFAILLAREISNSFDESANNKIPWFLKRKVLIGFLCFVPIFGFLATITFVPRIGRLNSQMNIVEIFNKHAKTASAKLVYVQQMPSSADFYSGGKAVDISDDAHPQMMERLQDQKEDHYVVHHEHIQRLPSIFFERTKLIGRYGEFIIRQEREFGL